MARRGYSSSDRPVDDLNPPPGGPAPGAREHCSPPEPGDVVWQYGVEHALMPDGTLRERVMFDRRPLRRRLAEALVDAIFCPACLCLRIHPTHLLVCSDRRRKVIRRAR